LARRTLLDPNTVWIDWSERHARVRHGSNLEFFGSKYSTQINSA